MTPSLPAFFTIRRINGPFVKVFSKISSIYGHGRGQELGAFQKKLKTALLPYGETQTVLSGCFPIYGEKHGVLITCFSQKRFVPLIYGHGTEKNLTTLEKISENKKLPRKSCGSSRLSSRIVI